jgi:hypothetical protein
LLKHLNILVSDDIARRIGGRLSMLHFLALHVAPVASFCAKGPIAAYNEDIIIAWKTLSVPSSPATARMLAIVWIADHAAVFADIHL